MSNLKVVVCVVLLAGVISGSLVLPKVPEQRIDQHNYYECTPGGPFDKFLFESPEASGKFLQIQTQTVVYPEHGASLGIIKCIKVTDLASNNNGGYVTITTGGVGYDHVTITLTSQRSKGFKFEVDITGSG